MPNDIFLRFENIYKIDDFHEYVVWLAPEYHLCHPIAYSLVTQNRDIITLIWATWQPRSSKALHDMFLDSWCDVFWKPSNFQNFLVSGDLLGLLSGLGPEILENCPLEISWAHFPGWGKKCFETVLWRLPGLTFRAGARNASKLSSGSFLGSLSGLGPEMLQNYPLDAFWVHFPGYVQGYLRVDPKQN